MKRTASDRRSFGAAESWELRGSRGSLLRPQKTFGIVLPAARGRRQRQTFREAIKLRMVAACELIMPGRHPKILDSDK